MFHLKLHIICMLFVELLDEEFGEASENYDESTINPAVDLGLMVDYLIIAILMS